MINPKIYIISKICHHDYKKHLKPHDDHKATQVFKLERTVIRRIRIHNSQLNIRYNIRNDHGKSKRINNRFTLSLTDVKFSISIDHPVTNRCKSKQSYTECT